MDEFATGAISIIFEFGGPCGLYLSSVCLGSFFSRGAHKYPAIVEPQSMASSQREKEMWQLSLTRNSCVEGAWASGLFRADRGPRFFFLAFRCV